MKTSSGQPKLFFSTLAMAAFLLVLGVLFSIIRFLRRVHYEVCRLSLAGLREQQEEAVRTLLQYKTLLFGGIAARGFTAADTWIAEKEAVIRKRFLISHCRTLRIPEWRIKLAS